MARVVHKELGSINHSRKILQKKIRLFEKQKAHKIWDFDIQTNHQERRLNLINKNKEKKIMTNHGCGCTIGAEYEK